MRMMIAVLATLAAAPWLSAQDANVLITEAKQAYTYVKNNILKSAQKMPEENYGFKPAPRVRTFGQILGHVAEEQYFYCSSAKGEQKAVDVERTKTSKAELVAALQDSFGYCDAVFESLTDQTAVQVIDVGQGRHTGLRMLWVNTIHNSSHYGNVVTYLRLKGFVPPSTEEQ